MLDFWSAIGVLGCVVLSYAFLRDEEEIAYSIRLTWLIGVALILSFLGLVFLGEFLRRIAAWIHFPVI